MRNLKRIAPIVLILAIACSANANKTAYATVGATVKLVDLAMRTWADYVVAGHATADQEAKVRKAHDDYRQAARTAAVVLDATNATPTPAQFSSAAAAVVSLIESLTGKTLVKQ